MGQRIAATVLVVEDDVVVLETILLVLESLRCRTLGAENGTKVASLLDNDEHIDLVVADAILPGRMNGLQVVKTVRRRCPTTRAILMSGYLGTQLGAEDSLASGVRLLEKPFQKDELATALTEALRRVSRS